MNTFVLLLSLGLVVIALGIAFSAWRLLRASGESEPDEFSLAVSDLSTVQSYQPMVRLFGRADLAFLHSQGVLAGRLGKRMRRERRRILRLFLKEIRADFQRAFTVFWIVARESGDTSFAAKGIRHTLVFYSSLLALGACSRLGWLQLIPSRTTELVETLNRFRELGQSLALVAPQPTLT